MDNPNRTIEDLLNLTDTEDSSSSNSGLFDTNQQFVLELHDIKKNDPQTENAPQTDLKIKKRRKKRVQPQADKSNTSTSSDVSDTTPKPEDLGKEQFFDANSSLHDLPDNQAKPAATVALAQAHSEHGQDPKTEEMVVQKTSVTPRQPSTITKPVAPPDP